MKIIKPNPAGTAYLGLFKNPEDGKFFWLPADRATNFTQDETNQIILRLNNGTAWPAGLQVTP